MAGVASVMCSYSASFSYDTRLILNLVDLINGTYACENDKMMNDILKREFGFQGFVMSDWGATESTMAAVTGLDVIISCYLSSATLILYMF